MIKQQWTIEEIYISSNEIAFQNLIHEINDDLVVHKKVFRMTQLLEKYKAYLLADTGTKYLQHQLENHFPTQRL
jgi:GTP cyclohydrolase II